MNENTKKPPDSESLKNKKIKLHLEKINPLDLEKEKDSDSIAFRFGAP
jgi:hypothetical protein